MVIKNEIKKYPKITSAAIIVNKSGKVFLMRGERFAKKFHLPGGHLEWGESIVDCLKREIKEETGLIVYDEKFLLVEEFIFYDLYNKNSHIIPLVYVVRTNDGEDAVKLEAEEASDYTWRTEEEIIKSDDLEPRAKSTAMVFFEKQKKENKCEEYKIGWQRALADYQNLQKETAARRSELVAMSELMILEEFIPVYDNFRKAFNNEQKANSKEQENWAMGIRYIMKQFGDVLKAHGVEEIKTIGEKFDPKFHESVGEDAVEGKEHGIIIKEIDGGYMMKDRVVKVAKVIIAK